MRRPEPPNRRHIDRFRDGAGQAQIEGGTGAIVRMITIESEHRLYFLTERGLASAQMADQIDPERQNPNIPQFVQRMDLSYGADAPFMQRSLCVGAELFQQAYLPERIAKDAPLTIALSVAKEFAEVADTIKALSENEAETRARLGRGEIQIGVIPRTPNLNGRIEQAVHHLRAVQLAIVRLCDLFYPRRPPKAKFNTSFLAAVRAAHPEDASMIENSEIGVGVLDRIANFRNAVIHHADGDKRLICSDYELRADGSLLAPTIAIEHPQTPVLRQDAVRFLDQQLEDLSATFEMFVVLLCDRNARNWDIGLLSYVAAMPEGQLRNGSRYEWNSAWREGFPRVEERDSGENAGAALDSPN